MIGAHLAEARLVALGLGEMPSSAEADHLGLCVTCGAALEDDARLWAGLRQLPLPEPPPGFAAGALVGYRRARAVRHQPREVLAGSLVVAGLVAVLCFWAWQQAPGALVSFALALPHWSSAVSQGGTWTRALVAVVPVLLVSAGFLLGGVAVLLRRLALVPVK